MKSMKVINGVAMAAGIPLFLLVVGCNKSDNASNSTGMTTAGGETNASVNADNSGRNERDRNGATLTSGDQGGSDADRAITQKIREALVSETNNYSMDAKNIKIITTNGMVTLRGPVSSDTEKTGIEGIAKNVAGSDKVDDQLEVKANR